jgi:hypothetical protein
MKVIAQALGSSVEIEKMEEQKGLPLFGIMNKIFFPFM